LIGPSFGLILNELVSNSLISLSQMIDENGKNFISFKEKMGVRKGILSIRIMV